LLTQADELLQQQGADSIEWRALLLSFATILLSERLGDTPDPTLAFSKPKFRRRNHYRIPNNPRAIEDRSAEL